MTSGVPQGTALVPIVFIVCIKTLLTMSSTVQYNYFCLFAGYYTVKRDCVRSDVQELQEDLKSLELWENTSLLKFSIPKFLVLVITRAIKYKIRRTGHYLHGTLNLP